MPYSTDDAIETDSAHQVGGLTPTRGPAFAPAMRLHRAGSAPVLSAGLSTGRIGHARTVLGIVTALIVCAATACGPDDRSELGFSLGWGEQWPVRGDLATKPTVQQELSTALASHEFRNAWFADHPLHLLWAGTNKPGKDWKIVLAAELDAEEELPTRPSAAAAVFELDYDVSSKNWHTQYERITDARGFDPRDPSFRTAGDTDNLLSSWVFAGDAIEVEVLIRDSGQPDPVHRISADVTDGTATIPFDQYRVNQDDNCSPLIIGVTRGYSRTQYVQGWTGEPVDLSSSGVGPSDVELLSLNGAFCHDFDDHIIDPTGRLSLYDATPTTVNWQGSLTLPDGRTGTIAILTLTQRPTPTAPKNPPPLRTAAFVPTTGARAVIGTPIADGGGTDDGISVRINGLDEATYVLTAWDGTVTTTPALPQAGTGYAAALFGPAPNTPVAAILLDTAGNPSSATVV